VTLAASTVVRVQFANLGGGTFEIVERELILQQVA
jgi:hypothetical protein